MSRVVLLEDVKKLLSFGELGIHEAIEKLVAETEAGPLWEDSKTPEDEAIKAVHPVRSGRHELFQRAQELIHPRRSKYALVEMVNWLLHRIDDAEQKVRSAPNADAVFAARALLINSLTDIDFAYHALTKTEKEMVTKTQFTALVSWIHGRGTSTQKGSVSDDR